MTRVRVRGFKIFDDRHGKPRCYHRKTGHAIDLTVITFGSAEFFAECERIRAISDAKEAQQPKKGTLAGLIETYKRSERFRDLAPRTRRDYMHCAKFVEKIGDTPVSRITVPLVSGIIEKASERIGWRQANMLRTFLSQVFQQCVPLGLIDKDFTTGVLKRRRPKAAPRANRPWTREECAAVLANVSPQLRAVIAMMMNTGLDPSDAIRVTRTQIEGQVIRGVRGKTGEPVSLPVTPALAAALAEAPEHDAVTVLASSRRLPWTYDGLASSWQRARRDMEAKGLIGPGLTLKGIRHTVATTLREAGCDPRRIADLLGQKTVSMALHYSRDANLDRRNAETIKTLEKANLAGTEIVKPPRKKRQTPGGASK
ncbi:tyrosine-type recombinase/integrase [Paroceanicella profunda]|nr:tyrosine-type recombinase/integrase [Paroceanicella profunda]